MKKLLMVLMAVAMVFGFAAMASAAAGEDVCTTCEEDPGTIPMFCGEQKCMLNDFDYDHFGKTDTTSCNDGSYCETGAKGDVHRALLNICNCIPEPFVKIGVGDIMDITMTIKVDSGNGPVTGANGVYWADPVSRIPVRTFNDANEACELPCNEDIGKRAFEGPFVYVDATGDTTDVFPNACKIESKKGVADRAVTKIKSASSSDKKGFVIEGGDADNQRSTWWVDIPAMTVDAAVAEEGDKVYVEICVSAEGIDFSNICKDCVCCCEIYIGELTCDCSDASSSCKDTLIFPYLPKTASYWYGMAITNLSSIAGPVTITLYENDGDMATLTVNLDANEAAVIPVDDFVVSASSKGSKVLGDAQSYAKAVATGISVSGFGMMAKIADGTSSMGYLAEKIQCGDTCTCFSGINADYPIQLK